MIVEVDKSMITDSDSGWRDADLDIVVKIRLSRMCRECDVSHNGAIIRSKLIGGGNKTENERN